jgi:energy-coupling factor transporter ATP-binding protein EcfA2
MPHLEHVSIAGFKKIEQLEFSPGQFNVVTGRNNSGKTSLLEATSLWCDLGRVGEFESDFDSITNRSHEAARLSTQTESEVAYREVALLRPDETLTFELLLFAFENVCHEFFTSLNADIQMVEDVIDEEARRVLRIVVEREEINMVGLRNQFLLVRVGGDEFHYLSASERIRETLRHGIDEMRTELVEKLDIDVATEGTERRSKFEGYLGYYANSGFMRTRPPVAVRNDFIDISSLLNGPNGFGAGEDAVKEDDIGDFLREKEIVDDLKSFSLDHLVFDPEDEEKYSVPFDQMGEGFKAIVGILWELLDDDLPEVVFLEEPDTHMHPGYVRELVYFLIDLAREEDIQLFVTTHNNDFLNDLFVENLTEEEIEFLEAEFRLIQMQDGAADVMDYEEAEHTLEDLMLDLRGL